MRPWSFFLSRNAVTGFKIQLQLTAGKKDKSGDNQSHPNGKSSGKALHL